MRRKTVNPLRDVPGDSSADLVGASSGDPIDALELPCDRPVRDQPRPDQVAAEAERALSALKEQYDGLVANDIAKLRALWQEADQNPDKAEDALTQIFALCHDIKGQAATFGYPLLTDVAALLCGFLRFDGGPTPPKHDEATLSVVAAHIEALDVLLTNKVREQSEGQGVIAALQALIARVRRQSDAHYP
ncbi:MAG: Hpt domain-containing protein [Pseudomonadota bacterium]